jgi:hypothetical protein
MPLHQPTADSLNSSQKQEHSRPSDGWPGKFSRPIANRQNELPTARRRPEIAPRNLTKRTPPAIARPNSLVADGENELLWPIAHPNSPLANRQNELPLPNTHPYSPLANRQNELATPDPGTLEGDGATNKEHRPIPDSSLGETGEPLETLEIM